MILGTPKALYITTSTTETEISMDGGAPEEGGTQHDIVIDMLHLPADEHALRIPLYKLPLFIDSLQSFVPVHVRSRNHFIHCLSRAFIGRS
jgi:hypothetical protein